MASNFGRALALTVLTTGMAAAHAASPAATTDAANPAVPYEQGAGSLPSVQDLSAVQASTLMLRAENAMAEEARRKAAHRGASGDADNPVSVARQAPPVVARVAGNTQEPIAYLLLGDGSIVPATVGVTVPGGYKITAVSARQVLARVGGETVALGFAVNSPALMRRAPTQEAAR